MNPENSGFINHEEEARNMVENKEKKEYVNLSLASAADLVKQIESQKINTAEGLDLNHYQAHCDYAVIYNKISSSYDIWGLADNSDFTDFLQELPVYYQNANDKDMKIFFCGSQYDIPLDTNPKERYNLEEIESSKSSTYLTPDGIKYRKDFPKITDKDGKEHSSLTIKYFDNERLPLEEVEKQSEMIKNKFAADKQDKFSRPFREYHFEPNELEENKI